MMGDAVNTNAASNPVQKAVLTTAVASGFTGTARLPFSCLTKEASVLNIGSVVYGFTKDYLEKNKTVAHTFLDMPMSDWLALASGAATGISPIKHRLFTLPISLFYKTYYPNKPAFLHESEQGTQPPMATQPASLQNQVTGQTPSAKRLPKTVTNRCGRPQSAG